MSCDSIGSYHMLYGKPVIERSIDSILDYAIDLGPWLALVPDDVLATATWTLGSGLKKDADHLPAEGHTNTIAFVWIEDDAGIAVGDLVEARCLFTTTPGLRQDQRSIWLSIVDR